jgi:hypothetical protein
MRYIQPEGHINTKSAAGVSCRKCGTVPNRLGVCVGWLGCLGVSRTGAGVSRLLDCLSAFCSNSDCDTATSEIGFRLFFHIFLAHGSHMHLNRCH